MDVYSQETESLCPPLSGREVNSVYRFETQIINLAKDFTAE